MQGAPAVAASAPACRPADHTLHRDRIATACRRAAKSSHPAQPDCKVAGTVPFKASHAMLDDWNSQLTEAGEQPGLGDLAGAVGGTSGGSSDGDLFGLDHRAEYISRWA